jgi:HEAT repeat protein
VLGQVFDSLLQIERERGVKFVAGFMDSTDPEIRDEAALALGSCRVPDAIKTLMQKCTDTRSNEFRPVLLRALSSSRDESAILFLLDLVKTGTTRDAAGALDALQIHADSADIQDRIMNAKAERQNS